MLTLALLSLSSTYFSQSPFRWNQHFAGAPSNGRHVPPRACNGTTLYALALGSEVAPLSPLSICGTDQLTLPTAQAGGAGPARAGRPGLPDHLITSPSTADEWLGKADAP